MKTLLLRTMFTACCFGAIVACKPTEPTPPMKTSETAVVEEKIRKFKAEPSKVNMNEVEKALADLNSETARNFPLVAAGGIARDRHLVTRRVVC